MIHENCTYTYLKKQDQLGINTKLCIYPTKYKDILMSISAYFINTSIIIIIFIYLIYKNI